jgi:four helix bundle protein
MKSEFAEEFKTRTKQFALRCLNLLKNLPKDSASQIIGKQLFRSASSVASNYRAVCRSRSNAEFYSKLSIVVEEADETVFWLEMLMEGHILPKVKLESLHKESIEILAIVSASRKTVKKSKLSTEIKM